jgi:hypothetical protein
MKKEAERQKELAEDGVDTQVPDGFGLPQKEAETFRAVQLKPKKRKLEEISGGPSSTEHDAKFKRLN